MNIHMARSALQSTKLYKECLTFSGVFSRSLGWYPNVCFGMLSTDRAAAGMLTTDAIAG